MSHENTETTPSPELTSKVSGAPHQAQHLGKGILFMMAGSILFAIAGAMAKLVTQSYPLAQVVWLRSFFGIALISMVILVNGKRGDFKTSRSKIHFVRSIAGLIMTVCVLVGLKYIPLGE